MLLKRLFQGIYHKTYNEPDEIEITGIAYDSRKVQPGDIFFALPGTRVGGSDFLLQAIGRGAVACVTTKAFKLPSHVGSVVVDDIRHVMAICASRYFGHPTGDVPCVGITGTNGKTTTSFLVESIMKVGGMKPGLLGTIENRYEDVVQVSSRTTPESVDAIQSILKFITAGAASVVMEVSSHALAQSRVDGISFDVGVFTNLTRDHLDYHKDMESYFEAKAKLFVESLKASDGRSVINIDDDFGARLVGRAPRPITVSLRKADIYPSKNLTVGLSGISGEINTPTGPVLINSPLIGQYNLQNIMCAIGVGIALGIPIPAIAKGISTMVAVPGRMQVVPSSKGITALVDYAHTDDALKNALLAVKDLNPARIITVFGCGGDRDRTKRPAMAKVAQELSDIFIVTSDNPRTEDPDQILKDICAGLTTTEGSSEKTLRTDSETGLIIEKDRRRAIETAIRAAKPGDVVLVAGKGHENYQIVGSETLYFSDVDEVRRALGEDECSET